MNKDKEYFINWLEKISLKICLIKNSQNNYKRFFQKNMEKKLKCLNLIIVFGLNIITSVR